MRKRCLVLIGDSIRLLGPSFENTAERYRNGNVHFARPLHFQSNQPRQDSILRAGPQLVPISFPLFLRSTDARCRKEEKKGKAFTWQPAFGLRVACSQLTTRVRGPQTASDTPLASRANLSIFRTYPMRGRCSVHHFKPTDPMKRKNASCAIT